MRVFFDTNVLISAFAARGLSADLLELVLIEHDLISGRTVLGELEKNLRAKIKLPPARCAEIVAFIVGKAARIVHGAPEAECNADKDDRFVLGEAIAGDCEVFVTGDAALVALGAIGRMRILTPRQLWEAFRSR